MNLNKIKKSYRADIDGLRAIAVSVVILFHLGIGYFPSGFIGVDIFFVISGYLITGIILSSLREDTFSYSDFFVRRLWRIQPALLFVGIVTLLASSILFVSPDYLDYLKSAKYNSLLISNQYFSRQSVAYATPESDIFPLLHTWSLAVEWQWYILLPFFIAVAIFLKNRLPSTKDINVSDNFILALWIVITFISAALALFMAKKEPGESYYFLSTRIFEFCAGGTTYLLTSRMGNIHKKIVTVSNILAIAVIIYVSTKEHVIDIYPNVNALLVVACTCFLILSGKQENNLVSRLLSLKPFSFFGKLSYSLYLWHWPILAYCRYVDIQLTGLNLMYICGSIIAMSLIGYYFIEQPMRRFKYSLKLTVTLLLAFPALLYSILYSVAVKHQGFPERLGPAYSHQFKTIQLYESKAVTRKKCIDTNHSLETCILGDLEGNKTALVIGDSNSNHFWGFLDVLGKKTGIKINALSVSSCLTFPEIWQYDWWIYKNKNYEYCHNKTAEYYNLIKNNKFDYVIIGEVWQNYSHGPYLITKRDDARSDALTKERMTHAAKLAISKIIESGARPVIMKTIYPMPKGYQECRQREAILRNEFSETACDTPRIQEKESLYLTKLFDILKEEYPSLMFIDPKKIQCKHNICISHVDSIPVYRDVGHLTDYASYVFGERYLIEFGNPLRH